MLRTQGVPARVAVGYVLDIEDLNTATGTFAVRKNDAYSWVEVYFPTYGWVDFNPSEELTLLGTGLGELLLAAENSEIPEFLLDLIPLETFLDDGTAALEALLTPIDLERGNEPPWVIIWSVGGVLALVVIVLLGTRVVWVWGLRGLNGMPRSGAGWSGSRDGPGCRRRSRKRFASGGRVLGTRSNVPEEANALSTAFEEARYGPPDLERTDPEETGEAYRALRNALAARLFGRKSPRGDEEERAEPLDEGEVVEEPDGGAERTGE